MSVAEQALAHGLPIRVGDLAAQEGNGERRHRRTSLVLLWKKRPLPSHRAQRAERGSTPARAAVRRPGSPTSRRLAPRERSRRASTTVSSILATTTSASGSSSRSTSACATSSSTPFARAVSAVTSTATSSRSTARTGAKPRRAAATATTPDPQPASSRLPRSSPARRSMHARVVGCAPVPNARPGSTTTASSPAGGAIHGGPIQIPPARTGRWNSFQRSSHPPETGSLVA